MMKKRRQIAVIVLSCAAVCVLGAMLVLGWQLLEHDKEEPSAVSASESNQDGQGQDADADGEAAWEAETAGNAVLEDSMSGTADESGTVDGAADESGMPNEGAWQDSLSGAANAGGDTGQNLDNGEGSTIAFPYAIPNTNLIIQNITGYDGVFLEDGTDSDAAGIASAVLVNSGGSNVEYARITLNCNGSPLVFEISDIAAGSSVVAQEVNRAGYQEGVYTDCIADVAELDAFEMSENQVKVEENEDGSLTITNLTGEEIPCVRVFYKFYMNEENAYVGGITYTAKLTNLEANGSQKITPSHYLAGYSRIMMVRIYDTAD